MSIDLGIKNISGLHVGNSVINQADYGSAYIWPDKESVFIGINGYNRYPVPPGYHYMRGDIEYSNCDYAAVILIENAGNIVARLEFFGMSGNETFDAVYVDQGVIDIYSEDNMGENIQISGYLEFFIR